jgi:hypothetical protein
MLDSGKSQRNRTNVRKLKRAHVQRTQQGTAQLIGWLHFSHQLLQAEPNPRHLDGSINWRQRMHRLSSLVG